MTGFDLDFSKANDGNIQDGTYETVIAFVKEDANQNTGTEFINFDLIVRNDLDQKYKNSHVFHRVWRAKETGKYNQGMLMAIAKAAGMQDGKHYNSFDDFMHDFTGQPVKITVRNKTREYNGKTYDDVNITRWASTDFPQVAHKWKDGTAPQSAGSNQFGNQTEVVDVSDDDLPF